MKHTKPYGAGRNEVMRKLIALGLLVATLAFAGTAFAAGSEYAGWPVRNPVPTFFGPNTAG